MINYLLLNLYAQGAFTVPLSRPNRTFNPSSLSMWAKYQLMPTGTYRGNLRDIEQAGILQLTLFVPIGTDDETINDKANEIAAHFGTEKAHSIDGHNLLIMSSHIESAMPDDGSKWYMQPISIEYQVI